MLKLSSGFINIARGLAVAAGILIYALLVHFVNASVHSGSSQPLAGILNIQTLGAILALAPLSLIVLAFALKMQSRLIGACLLLMFCILCWFLWSFIKQHTSLIFWLLDIGLMFALLMTFGQTLLNGRKPLCVYFAEMINGGPLPADHENYARNVTIAWVLFFAAMIIVSTALFFLAPLSVWSFFVNFLTLPLVALMFIIEFIVRKRLLTNLPAGNVMDAVIAYLEKARLDKAALDKSAQQSARIP